MGTWALRGNQKDGNLAAQELTECGKSRSEEKHVCNPAEQQKHSKLKHYFYDSKTEKIQLVEQTAVAYQ